MRDCGGLRICGFPQRAPARTRTHTNTHPPRFHHASARPFRCPVADPLSPHKCPARRTRPPPRRRPRRVRGPPPPNPPPHPPIAGWSSRTTVMVRSGFGLTETSLQNMTILLDPSFHLRGLPSGRSLITRPTFFCSVLQSSQKCNNDVRSAKLFISSATLPFACDCQQVTA